MQNIFTNIKCSEIILYNANENWYIILYDLFSRLCYIATCGPFCKYATHMSVRGGVFMICTCMLSLSEYYENGQLYLKHSTHKNHLPRMDTITSTAIWGEGLCISVPLHRSVEQQYAVASKLPVWSPPPMDPSRHNDVHSRDTMSPS